MGKLKEIPWPPKEHTLRQLRDIGWRVVSTRRKKTLVKRGEFAYWNLEHGCWLWESQIIRG